MSTEKKRRRWPRIVVGALAVMAIAVAAAMLLDFRPFRQGASSAAGGLAAGPLAASAEELQTVRAHAATTTESIEVSGNVEVSTHADLAFATAGEVEAIFVSKGELVESKQRLAILDNDAARYNLAGAEKQLDEARVSGNTREVELLELDLRLKEEALEDHELTSPFAGVASSVEVEVGDHVSTGQAVVRLVDRTALTAILEVDEIDMPRVDEGQSVSFTFDALPDREYEGAITYIPVEGRVTSQGFAVFDVEAEISNAPAELLPGYSFVAEIIVTPERSIVTVPEDAVLSRNGRSVVLIQDQETGTPMPRSVEVGSTVAGGIEVLDGIEPGELVIIPSDTDDAESTGAGFQLPFMPGAGGGRPGGGRPGGGAPGGAPATGAGQ